MTASVREAGNPLWLHRLCHVSNLDDVLENSRKHHQAVNELHSLERQEEMLSNASFISEDDRRDFINALQHRKDEALSTIASTSAYGITIGHLCRTSGEKKARAFVMVELIKLNSRLNLNNPLTETDIEFIADDIVASFKSLTVADIALVIDDICRGKYGQFYERLNATKILPCFQQHLNERMEAAEAYSIRQHSANTSTLPDFSDDDIELFYKTFKAIEKSNSEIDKMTETMQHAIDAANDYAKRIYSQKGGRQ